MTTPPERPNGVICTFYSYKGGVGRSMALANVAVLLAQWGSNVLVVDWDLEAPGIERYFEEIAPGCREEVREKRGIVDIAEELSRGIEGSWRDGIIQVPVPGSASRIDLLSAGRRDPAYVQRLQRLDWDALFRDCDFGRRLEDIRNDWLQSYDYVLIDSRTGITDIGGICTIYLPDVLIALFTANHQSVEGITDVVSRARRARASLPVDRGALVCIPVPARDESRTEYQQSVAWRNIYRDLLSQFYADFLPRNVSAADALDLLRIPNVPFWSFGERLPVLTEAATDPSGITYYYVLLARLLATDLSWQDSTQSPSDVSGGSQRQAVAQAVLGSGVQNVYFGDVSRGPELAATVTPPFGRRDERHPIRGRDELLAELLDTGSPRVVVVHGLGGCGKSRLVLEAAYQVQQRGWETWWISARDADSLAAGMLTVGRRMSISDEDLKREDVADLIWQRLAARTDPWALVIDGADDPQVLAGRVASVSEGRGWLRPTASSTGLVLVTSRDGTAESWGPWCSRLRLGVLAVEDAVQVLGDFTGDLQELGSEDDARELALRLGGLPLALTLAGSYLAESARVPARFAELGLVRTYRQYLDAISSGDRGDIPNSGSEYTFDQLRPLIGQTWSLSLDLLATQGLPEARALLRLLACFARAPVPYELVLDPAVMSASSLFDGITGLRLWQVLTALHDFGLVELGVHYSADAIPAAVLHPLVYDVAATPSGPVHDGEAYLRLSAQLLLRAVSAPEIQPPENPVAWPAWQLLAPHAIHAVEKLARVPDYPDSTTAIATARAGYMAARYQESQGLYAQSALLLQAVSVIQSTSPGPDHPDTLVTRREIARTMRQQGQYSSAEAELHEVLAAQQTILGTHHQSTLITSYEIARVMADRGQFAAAEAEFRSVLAAWQRILGPDDSATLAARHDIARVTGERGDHAAAEAELRDVLASQARILGPDHLDTLITRQEIAAEMRHRGDYAAAEAELRDVLAAQLRVLGPDHPTTLATRYQIAQIMADQGDNTQAEAELREVQAVQLRVLGRDHPAAAATARLLRSVTGNLHEELP
jgi:MinD-like ATPase involved in chromosome partitioning or flagellar assembly/tetratricopeptide (TPR) repeat protein